MIPRSLLLMLFALVGIAGHAAPAPTSIRVVLDDNYPPYIFRDASGQVQGIVKDLWDLWQQRTGVIVDFRPMDWGKARAAMESGQADVIDTIFATEERRKLYDFSRPYATIDVPIYFHHSIGGITNAASLRGFMVGVKEGDACIDHLLAHGVSNLRRYASYEAAVKAAIGQELRVLCIDKPPAVYFFNREGVANEFRHSQPLYAGAFHWAVAKGRPELKHLVEAGFSRITPDERAAIDARWLGTKLESTLWPGVARYGGYLLLAVALLIATLLAWSWTLRRRVAVRTAELAASNGALRTSEARLRSLTAMSSDFFWETDAEHRLLSRSSANEARGTGSPFRRAPHVGERRWEVPYLSPDEAGWQAHRAVVDAHRPFRHFEVSRPGPDGNAGHALLSGDPVFDDNGAFAGYQGVGVDITERKSAEARVAYLNRIYAMLSGTNALIARALDRDELFTEACRIAVAAGGFRMAWIAIVDRSVMKIVPVASAGADARYMTALKEGLASSRGAVAGDTAAARAIRERTFVVFSDLADNPAVMFGKEYATAGIGSMAVLPLIVADEPVGVLALFASERDFFHDSELKALTELTDDISFGIDHLGKRERLDYLAYYDQLTGLANRSLFLDRVAQFLRAAAGGGHKLALFLIDVERFKNINDSLGRPAGDEILKQVGTWLTSNAGDASLLGRLDADHFAAVMPEVRREGDLAHLVESTLDAFVGHPFHHGDSVFRLAAKVGVALYPEDGADADTLFKNAEAALKMAKASGARYLFHTRAMTDMTAGKLTLENQLRQALDNEEFVLHYQPKVNLVSGKLTGAEALIRWNDPRTGLVPPGRFIPILEETGLIHDVGRWALKQAIADYLRWRDTGLAAVRIAVNVSPLELHDRGYIAEIGQAIGIDPQAAAGLELEITESLIMEDVRHSIASLNAIRAMGVTIAIDDFGTGFSSLSYLARLPVDTLKIDRTFVSDMTAGPQGLSLVSTIINLARSLKLKVVAEGVETEEQSRLLRLLSCDDMQGFLLSKALPVAEFEERFLAPIPAA